MIRWLMRFLFDRVPTCSECGHQMPEGPYVSVAFGGSIDDVIEWEVCRKCGAADSCHYERIDWRHTA